MVYGDNPAAMSRGLLNLDAEYYLPSLLAMRQNGNLYVYCANNPILYTDSSGKGVILTWLAIKATETAGSAAVEGIKTGIIYAINGKSIWAGLVNGLSSGAIEGLISADGPVGKIMSSAIGAAVGAFTEEMVFNNGKIDSSMVNIIAESITYDLMLNLPRMYWGHAIDVASKADSITNKIMEFDPEFGQYMKEFFDVMVAILEGAI